MPDNQSTMQAYYGARAREYDRIYLKPERQADLRAIEQWLPKKFANKRILEIACGTGYWTQFIAPIARQVVAVDAAPETIEVARNRIPKERVEWVVGNAYALGTELGQFDAAFAGFWFSHIPKSRRREFLRRLAARLEPGAKVIFLDNRYVVGSSTPLSASDAEGNTFQTRTLDDGSTHEVLKNFPTEVELRDLIVGFGENAVYAEWEYYWVFEYIVS